MSSSIYRSSDLWPFLSRIEFSNPNTLEHNLSQFRHRFRDIAPLLLCYRQATTFCNPINIVNTACRFRSGERPEYSSTSLKEQFAQGFRLDVKSYCNFIPNACHQEVELQLCKYVSPTTKEPIFHFTESLKDETIDKFEAARKLKKLFTEMDLHEDATKIYANHLRDQPEDHDLVEALNYYDKNKAQTTKFATKISIIIPAYNCSDTIAKSLDSIVTSINYCREIIPDTNYEQWAEIIVVNDNSSDQTAATVNAYAATHFPDIRLCNNPQNLGAGPTRNLGVKLAQGGLIFFLDGDDLYFREHIFLCLYHLTVKPWLHFVQTGIRIDEDILPLWKQSIENTVPFNICVRRWCHDCIGGYPEGKAFQSMCCEDAFYRILLSRYFLGQTIKRETMQHFRYPGNALDRQMEKFFKPPSKTCSEEVMTEEELAVFPEIKQILAIKTAELENNFKAWQQKMGRRI